MVKTKKAVKKSKKDFFSSGMRKANSTAMKKKAAPKKAIRPFNSRSAKPSEIAINQRMQKMRKRANRPRRFF